MTDESGMVSVQYLSALNHGSESDRSSAALESTVLEQDQTQGTRKGSSKRVWSSTCIHGKSKPYCKECGGSQICIHGKIKGRCDECGGSSFCSHGALKWYCKECNGCIHGRVKSRCKQCIGSYAENHYITATESASIFCRGDLRPRRVPTQLQRVRRYRLRPRPA